MNQQEIMTRIEAIIEESKAGILASVDAQGRPHVRWMTPVVLAQWPNTLFSVTSPHFPKILQLDASNRVEWMIQTRTLDQVVNVRGRMNILDNPSLKAQVMEAIGKRLTVFWTVNKGSTDFIILETVIEEAAWTMPLKGVTEIVAFPHEEVAGEADASAGDLVEGQAGGAAGGVSGGQAGGTGGGAVV